MSGNFQILRLNALTLFTLDDRGRLACENEPGGSPAPALFISGNEAGNLVLLHSELSDSLARDVFALVAREPPWTDPNRRPDCLGDLTALISGERSVHLSAVGLIHELPKGLHQSVDASSSRRKLRQATSYCIGFGGRGCHMR